MEKKKKKPVIGYGANVGAGKKATKQVKSTVRKGVVSAAKKAGRQAAKGTGPKKYSKSEMVNRGTARGIVNLQSDGKTTGYYVATNDPVLDFVMGGVAKKLPMSLVNPKGEINRYVSRKVGSRGKANSSSLYERKAYKAYKATKKSMGKKK